MKKDVLNKYISKHLSMLEHYLHTYVETGKAGPLHELRVEIKKIKAILGFAQNIYLKKYSCYKLKHLFDKAGKIREIQINCELIQDLPIPSSQAITRLKKKESILRNQFLEAVPRYENNIQSFRQQLILPEYLPDVQKIKDCFHQKEKMARNLLAMQEREQLHSYRTKIKKIMYVYESLPKKMRKQVNLDIAKINKQQKKLGNWHDTYAATTFLSSHNSPVKDPAFFSKLKEKEQKQFDSFFRKSQ